MTKTDSVCYVHVIFIRIKCYLSQQAGLVAYKSAVFMHVMDIHTYLKLSSASEDEVSLPPVMTSLQAAV